MDSDACQPQPWNTTNSNDSKNPPSTKIKNPTQANGRLGWGTLQFVDISTDLDIWRLLRCAAAAALFFEGRLRGGKARDG